MGPRSRELGPGYSVEVDGVDEARWYSVLKDFDDASIYQTWAYDEVRAGRDNISHLLLKKDGEVAAAAAAVAAEVPRGGCGSVPAGGPRPTQRVRRQARPGAEAAPAGVS
jgi:hypothetical protein